MTPHSGTCRPQPVVRLHMEHLVLEGLPVDSVNAGAFQAALEQEAARLLGQVAPSGWRSRVLARVVAQDVTLAPNGGSSAWGREIARVVLTTAMPLTGGQVPPKPAGNSPKQVE